jgi:hypothetical protein
MKEDILWMNPKESLPTTVEEVVMEFIHRGNSFGGICKNKSFPLCHPISNNHLNRE